MNQLNWWMDVPSRRDEKDREFRYTSWLEFKGWEDTPTRRELHFRRYVRPEQPVL